MALDLCGRRDDRALSGRFRRRHSGLRQTVLPARVGADRIGAAHAVAVSSGTAGLHLALRAVGVSDGDEVVTTPFSFVASANVILY